MQSTTPDILIDTTAGVRTLTFNRLDKKNAFTPAMYAAMADALDAAEGKVLAYCRSGTRSIITWSLGEVAQGGDRADLAAKGAAAGYDLSGVMGV